MVDGMVLFQVVSTIIGVGTPVGTLLYSADKFGQRLKTIEDGHKECREERIKNECDLFDRVSEAEKGVAYQKGKMNGIAGRAKT